MKRSVEGEYLGPSKSFLPKINCRAMQIAPHLVVLYDAVAIKDEPNLVKGYVVVLEDDTHIHMNIESNLAIGHCALCMDRCQAQQNGCEALSPWCSYRV